VPKPATVVPLLGWRPSAAAEHAPKGLPVDELFEQVIRFVWSAPGIASKTRSNRVRTRELARALPSHPTPIDVMAWVESLRAQFAPGTADQHLRSLSAVYRYANDLGIAQGNPARFVPKLRRDGDPKPIVNIEQVWPALLDCCETPRERLWLALLRFTGIRRGEALGLWHDDVNTYNEPWRIEVVRQRPDPNRLDHTRPKSPSSSRELPVREPLRPFLADVLQLGPEEVRVGFGGGERRVVPYLCPFREEDLRRLGERLREVAPLAFPRGQKMWHALRDTLALEMRSSGKTTSQVSEALGHSSEYVTRMHYLGRMGRAVPVSTFEGMDQPRRSAVFRAGVPPPGVRPAAEKRTAGALTPAVQERRTEQVTSRKENHPCSTPSQKRTQRALPGLSVGPVVRKRKR
jgi:integrase